MKLRISFKIIIIFVAIICISTVSMAVYFFTFYKQSMFKEFEQKAGALLDSVVLGSEYPVLINDVDLLKKIGDKFILSKDVVGCLIYDENGTALYKNLEKQISSSDVRHFERHIVTETFAENFGEDFLLTEELSSQGKKEIIGKVEILLSIETLTKDINNLKRKLLFGLLITVLGALIIIVFLINVLLGKPIQSLIKGTQTIATGNLDHEVNLETSDEMGELANSFNAMIKDLKNITVSKGYVESIIEGMLDVLMILDAGGNVVSANNASEKLLGYEKIELIGRNFKTFINNSNDAILTPDDIFNEIVNKKDGDEGLLNFECEVLSKHNSKLTTLLSASYLKDSEGNVTDIIVILKDITDRKIIESQLIYANTELEEKRERLTIMLEEAQEMHKELKETQEQLLQTEKLAAIGQLAAGVAHEINNPLGYIISNFDIFKQYGFVYAKFIESYKKLIFALNKDDFEMTKGVADDAQQMMDDLNLEFISQDLSNLLKDSKDGLEHIKKIVSDLQTFSRTSIEEMGMENVEDLLENALSLMSNEVAYKAELIKDFQGVPSVLCNPSRLSQVFFNIIINALQSMEEKGKIKISTSVDSNYVYVTVSDTGSGISKENQQKIFNPFFTTKPVGKGTGLGLSISYDIIKQHQGDIQVESELGKGTKVIVSIPLKRNV